MEEEVAVREIEKVSDTVAKRDDERWACEGMISRGKKFRINTSVVVQIDASWVMMWIALKW